MTVQRTANQPIAFSGQLVAYDTGVANISQSSIIVGQTNVPTGFSQGIVQYTPSTGNPVVYTTV